MMHIKNIQIIVQYFPRNNFEGDRLGTFDSKPQWLVIGWLCSVLNHVTVWIRVGIVASKRIFKPVKHYLRPNTSQRTLKKTKYEKLFNTISANCYIGY